MVSKMHGTTVKKVKIHGRNCKYSDTWRLLRGSIRWTAPVVAKGNEHSCDMPGGSGVITCKAALGVKPKLKKKRCHSQHKHYILHYS